jgi:hypothetical protein
MTHRSRLGELAVSEITIQSILGLLGTQSSWAVLLCKFADDTAATQPHSHYERLFTKTGSGSMNMVDFFSDVSHGTLDLSGSEIFGWFTLPKNKADYVGNATPSPGQLDRNGLFALCRQTATNAGVDLSRFAGVVVSMNGAVDLFGYVGGMAAMCDSNSLQPSLLGQEMGHGYGLDHARRDGSTDDYQDPWDVMSTANAYEAPNSEYAWVGPGLNAWNMRSRGWLDESRVWTSSTPGFDATIQLRPLHRRDLPGVLAAELGDYLVEYRQQERWDAAIPRSRVLVHHFSDNHSYVAAGTNGNSDLAAGDSFQTGNEHFQYAPYSRLDVQSIDEGAQTATVSLAHRVAAPFPRYEIYQQVFGGIPEDGGGFVRIGGHFHPVPPRGPATTMLEQLSAYLAAETINDVAARSGARRSALEHLTGQALLSLAELDPIRTPAPRIGKEGGQS